MPHALLVEDDTRSLEALQEVVEKEGFTTSTATTLKQAREIMGTTAVDLLLTDLMLPDGSGMELAKDLQANPGSSTEVILITGHATVDSAVEALRMPVLDY